MNQVKLLKEHKIFCIKPYNWMVSLLHNLEEHTYIIKIQKYHDISKIETHNLGRINSIYLVENNVDKYEQYEFEIFSYSKRLPEEYFKKIIEKLENYILDSWDEIKKEINTYINEQEEIKREKELESIIDYYDEIHEESMKEMERESNIVVTLEVEASGYIYIPINLNIDDDEYLNYIENLASEDEKNPEDYILSKFKEANKSNEELFNLFDFREVYYDSFSEIKYNQIYYESLFSKNDTIGEKIINFDDFKTLENDSTSDIENHYQEISKGVQRKNGQNNLLYLLFRIKAKVKSTMYILINTMNEHEDYYEDYSRFYDTAPSLANPRDFIEDKIREYEYTNILVFYNGCMEYQDHSEIEFLELRRESSYMLEIDLDKVLQET